RVGRAPDAALRLARVAPRQGGRRGRGGAARGGVTAWHTFPASSAREPDLPEYRRPDERLGPDMRAITYSRFGSADVLELTEVPDPHVGPDTVVVRVRAASVNPVDWKVREGYLEGVIDTT